MRSIPGAVVVLAGAGLLATLKLVAYNTDVYAWVNLAIGLILCAVGMCDGRPRLRFTVRDMLWLTVAVAIIAAWRIDHATGWGTQYPPGMPVVGQGDRPRVE